MSGKPYKPDYISRKLFDKYQDRMDLRISRLKEDYRADIAMLQRRFQKIQDQMTQLFPIEDHEEEDPQPQPVSGTDLVQMKDGRWRRKAV